MKQLLVFLLAVLLGRSADATLAVYATNLPSQIGTYSCSYFSTNNANVPAMLELSSNYVGMLPISGVVWNFSQSQQTNESLQRTDIIAPANGTDGADFPNATYAEQDSAVTLTATNVIGWRYYSITNQGRYYYGLYEPMADADGLAVFNPATVDVPAVATNQQTWSRSTSWNTTVDGIYPLTYQFSDVATVDALGTVLLPNEGAIRAWRVHEVHGYTGLLYGYYPYEIVTNEYYYLLVPNLGVVAEITLYGNNTLYPEPLPFTNSVQRMYYASYFVSAMEPGTNSDLNALNTNLHIALQNGSVLLNWKLTNSTSYVVQANGSLSGTNWQVLGLTSQTNWTDALTATQRFYRVVGEP